MGRVTTGKQVPHEYWAASLASAGACRSGPPMRGCFRLEPGQGNRATVPNAVADPLVLITDVSKVAWQALAYSLLCWMVITRAWRTPCPQSINQEVSMKAIVVAVIIAMVSTEAMAQLPSNDPAVVCKYLDIEKLGASGWAVNEDLEGHCVSEIIGFGRESVGPLHQLSFVATGTPEAATLLQVVFDVNPPQAMSDANNAFLRVSHRLSTNAFGKRLPSSISSAITGGREATVEFEGATLSVSRQTHESGSGYQMRFSVQ